jgi:RNA polymerase sigma-70 factor (ECF subfamily)
VAETAEDARAAEFEEHRSRLFSLAYRMLGSAVEAEDAVQDAYLRWRAADRAAVRVPAAWLTRVCANLCLNRLTSARAVRESYVGPWLPEPVLTGGLPVGARPALDPLETAEQRDTVSLALLTLMERLTPAERAVFVLREAFAYPHAEIAGILDITEAGSRQLHRRARDRVAEERRRFDPSRDRWRAVVERFLDAARGGDIDRLESLLAEDATAWSDGGGRVTAARRPVSGADRVARLLAGFLRHAGPEHAITIEEVNGFPAVVAAVDGRPVAVLVLEVGGGRVLSVRTVVNPDKLAPIAGQFAARG